MKFEENCPGVSEEKSFKGVDRRRTTGGGRRTMDDTEVITIAHTSLGSNQLKKSTTMYIYMYVYNINIINI